MDLGFHVSLSHNKKNWNQKQEKVVLLLDPLEFVAGVNRVTSLCGGMRYFPTLIDMLKDQVQELGS